MIARRLVLAGLLTMSGGALLAADPASMPTPTGPVILTVSGAIGRGNAVGADGRPVARFDRAMLEALGLRTINTLTPWHDGMQKFEGVPAAALLAAVQGKGESVRAIALNEYATDLPVSDFKENLFILAIKNNEKFMAVRDKGPIFIIFPYDQFPRDGRAIIHSKSVWQLTRLEFR